MNLSLSLSLGSAALNTGVLQEISMVTAFAEPRLANNDGVKPRIVRYASAASEAVPCVKDAYGRLVTGKSLEVLFDGARRVENLVRYSEALTASEWTIANTATMAAVRDSRRADSNGDQTWWTLTRSTSANSILRTANGLRRVGRPAGLDLLAPVLHAYCFDVRQKPADTATAEIRVGVQGGATLATKVVDIGLDGATYALTFTPAAPVRITATSWSGGVLTVTAAGHGLSTGNRVRLSGSLPVALDFEAAVASAPGNQFTVPLAADPGASTALGWCQPAYVIGVSPTSYAATAVASCEVRFPCVSPIEGWPTDAIPEYVPTERTPPGPYWYGSNVDGVQCFKTSPTFSVATATGLVSAEEPTDLTTYRGVLQYAYATNYLPRKFSEYFTSWTKADASMAVSDSSQPGVQGGNTATLITEGTHNGEHSITAPAVLSNANTAASKISNYSLFVTAQSGWCWLGFTDRAGTAQRAFVNLSTGEAGTKTSGFKSVITFEYGAFWRICASVDTGIGGGAPALKIGIASADNTHSFQGAATRTMTAFGAMFVGGNLDRPTATVYARGFHESISSSTGEVAGCKIYFPIEGLLGASNWVVSARYTPGYSIADGSLVRYTAPFYLTTDGAMFISDTTGSPAIPGSMDRAGITIRPNPVSGFSINADHYVGDPNTLYFWEASTAVVADQMAIPTTTLPNNPGNETAWLARNAGTTGASEPTWTGTEVVDGEVTWDRVVNSIGGVYEPYDMAEIATPAGAMPELSLAYYVEDAGWGGFLDGVAMEVKTHPELIRPDLGGALRIAPTVLHLGSLGSTYGLDAGALTAIFADTRNVLIDHTSMIKDLRVISTRAAASQAEELSQAA